MTLIFATDWKLKRGCDACRRTPGKAMCPDCRGEALKRWHLHVANRVEKGLCISCTHKRVEGEQRCRRCKKLNRDRCNDWYYRVGKARVLNAKQQGICTNCMKHPSDGTETLCKHCAEQRRSLANGSRQYLKRPYRYVEMKLAA